jgi:hypothetical protein
MDEKPKSIWKKHFTGRTALVIWLAVVVFAVMLCCFIGALVNYNNYNWLASDTLQAAGFFAGGFLVVCLILIYVVWPLLRWLFWKHCRRTFFALACLATLIALFYAEEDWRGWHDWNKFKHEWEAKGEKFDYASIIPPRVPDDQNFAMQPIWVDSVKFEYGSNVCKQWYGVDLPESVRTNLVDRLNFNETGDSDWKNQPTYGSWIKATETDLRTWQNYYRTLATKTNLFPIPSHPQTPAQDVLLALSKYDSAIEELREAAKLPYSRFPLNYEAEDPAAILLPHLGDMKRCAQVLQLRAIAELQNDESQKAWDDVKLMMRLTDASRTEPFLISHLVRAAILNLTLQPVYEGLAEHKWSDAQLTDLDSELAKLDFLADYKLSMRGERGMDDGIIKFLRNAHKRPLQYIREISSLIGDDSGDFHMGFQMFALAFGPSGWFDQNELRICRFFSKWYLPAVDEHDQIIFPATIRNADVAMRREFKHHSPENLLESMLLPALGASARKFAYEQSSTDLARVAIALERYRLAQGEFPESLDAVAAQFPNGIPHDIIGGEPLKYRRTNDGQFVLYSVGWNETDDGGVVIFRPESQSPDISQGDWVWRYPQK